MNSSSPRPQYCGCKMLGSRWASPCPAHEAQYNRLVAMARSNRYQEIRRRAQMLAPKEVESCQ
jgi:hypothetical protein